MNLFIHDAYVTCFEIAIFGKGILRLFGTVLVTNHDLWAFHTLACSPMGMTLPSSSIKITSVLVMQANFARKLANGHWVKRHHRRGFR